MKLYGFMQDARWYEDIGHILIGLIPIWGWRREHRQWPPGNTVWIPKRGESDARGYSVPAPYAPHDRVADSYRDFLGYAIGDAIRTVVLVSALVWTLL